MKTPSSPVLGGKKTNYNYLIWEKWKNYTQFPGKIILQAKKHNLWYIAVNFPKLTLIKLLQVVQEPMKLGYLKNVDNNSMY